MTSPDHDDARPESGRRPELPADVDAAFAAIVADWASADDAPRWPATEPDGRDDDGPSSGLGTATPPTGHEVVEPRTPTRPAARRSPDLHPTDPPPATSHRPPTGPSESPEDEHYVPPEPPPMPRLGFSSLIGLGLLVIGVVLLAVPGLLGGPVGLGIVPGLLAMTAGLGWLVFGMRRSREQGDDGPGPDDGAIL